MPSPDAYASYLARLGLRTDDVPPAVPTNDLTQALKYFHDKIHRANKRCVSQIGDSRDGASRQHGDAPNAGVLEVVLDRLQKLGLPKQVDSSTGAFCRSAQ